MTAGQIAERFSCSWPTTTRHLKILERAKLLRVTKQGRERVYKLDLQKLRITVGKWLDWFEDAQRGPGPTSSWSTVSKVLRARPDCTSKS